MPDLIDAAKSLERLTFGSVLLPIVSQSDLLAAADAQVAFIGEGSRRDITFVCAHCRLPQSFRLFERFTRLDTDDIQKQCGQSCIGRFRVVAPKDYGLSLEVNALVPNAVHSMLGIQQRLLGCPWSAEQFDFREPNVLTVDMGSLQSVRTFAFAPVPIAQKLYALLDKQAPPA